MTTQSMKDTVVTVDAMKGAQQTMKETFKGLTIESVESLQDDMEDLLDTSNDIQNALGRSYAVPDDVDEADLEAELDSLGDDFMMGEEETPSYLQATNNVPTTEPMMSRGNPQAVQSYGDFNLPSVPSQLERGW